MRFFHFSNAQREGLARGTRLRCHGEVRRGPLGLELVHPEYRRVAALGEPLPQTLTPIYPLTEGLTQGRLRALVDRALRALDSARGRRAAARERARAPATAEPASGAASSCIDRRSGLQLAELAAGRHPAQRRLAFEELLAHQLSLLELRSAHAARIGHAARRMRRACEPRLLAALPFALTGAQRRVLAEVDHDLVRAHADGAAGAGRRRLRQDRDRGGRRRTCDRQRRARRPSWRRPSCWPSSTRARCSAGSIRSGVSVCLLTGSQPARARAAARCSRRPSGRAQLCVGTHALFQERGALPATLALAIIDEQHRFGVQQRLQLAAKARAGRAPPHQLIMSATPIPRTLAMTLYADLDVSIIDELPPGRTPVRTVVVPETSAPQIVARIDEACRAGRQAYWVCPLIEESEELDCQAAEETAAALAEALPSHCVELLHGRMPPKQQGAHHAALRRRRSAAAGGHHRDRGRRGRAQRRA